MKLFSFLFVALLCGSALAGASYDRVAQAYWAGKMPEAATIPPESIWAGMCYDNRGTDFQSAIWFHNENEDPLAEGYYTVFGFRRNYLNMNYDEAKTGIGGFNVAGYTSVVNDLGANAWTSAYAPESRSHFVRQSKSATGKLFFIAYLSVPTFNAYCYYYSKK